MLFLKTQPKSVFIGFYDVCNNLSSLALALKNRGYSVYTHSKKDLFFRNKYDSTWSYFNHPLWRYIPFDVQSFFVHLPIFFKVALKKKMLVFFWQHHFFPLGLDLFIFKILKRDIVFLFCGDDARYRPIHWRIDHSLIKEGVWIPREYSNSIFFERLWLQMLVRILKIKIFGHRETITFLQSSGYYISHQIKFDTNLKPKKNNTLVKIVHAPSNRIEKNTEFVLKSINELRKKNVKFDFQIVEGVENNELLKILSGADILIDQRKVVIPRLSAEGLSHGCVVINSHKDFQFYSAGQYEDDSPCISYPKCYIQLAELLYNLIKDSKKRKEISDRSYSFALKYYSEESFCKYMVGCIIGDIKPNLYPFKNQKKMLISASDNLIQKILIYLLYKQSNDKKCAESFSQ